LQRAGERERDSEAGSGGFVDAGEAAGGNWAYTPRKQPDDRRGERVLNPNKPGGNYFAKE
jgi:hypothetical protein